MKSFFSVAVFIPVFIVVVFSHNLALATVGDALVGDAPTSDAPTSDTPTSDTPTSDTPTSDTPTSDTLASDTLAGDKLTDKSSTNSSTIHNYTTNNVQGIEVLTQEELDTLRKKYEWLKPHLLSDQYLNVSSKSLNKKINNTFYPHFKDSLKFWPLPEVLNGELLNLTKPKYIKGKITYVWFFPKKYKYSIVPDKNGFVIEVRVHFKKASEGQKRVMRRNFDFASQLWNNHKDLMPIGVPYKFKFLVADSKSNSHFSVKLKKGTRGPYDTCWDPNWHYGVVAHEIGHMLGLGDEYGTLEQHNKCLSESLMCRSSGHPLRLHYYHILRRIF